MIISLSVATILRVARIHAINETGNECSFGLKSLGISELFLLQIMHFLFGGVLFETKNLLEV